MSTPIKHQKDKDFWTKTIPNYAIVLVGIALLLFSFWQSKRQEEIYKADIEKAIKETIDTIEIKNQQISSGNIYQITPNIPDSKYLLGEGEIILYLLGTGNIIDLYGYKDKSFFYENSNRLFPTVNVI